MIKITVDNSHEFYQFDVNRSVIVSGLDPGVKYEFHFTTDNMDSVIVKETTTDDSGNVISKIPNQLLTEPYPIILLIYGSSNDITKTYCKHILTPIARPKPDGYILPDDEDDVNTYNILKSDIEALKKAVEDLKEVDYSAEIELLKSQSDDLFNFKAEKSYVDEKGAELVQHILGALADYITGADLERELSNYADKNYINTQISYAIDEALEGEY